MNIRHFPLLYQFLLFSIVLVSFCWYCNSFIAVVVMLTIATFRRNQSDSDSQKSNENPKSKTKYHRKANKKKYTRLVEKYIEKELSSQLKKLTRTEGQILIKLIYRETGQTVHQLIKELRNGFRAFSYSSLAKLFDISIKTTYNPEKIKEDAIIEDVLKRAYGDKSIILDLN